MRSSPLADPAFVEAIDYESGVTLISIAKLLPLKDREKQLDEARKHFQKFLAEHPQHRLVTSANTNLANLLVSAGGFAWSKRDSPTARPNNRNC